MNDLEACAADHEAVGITRLDHDHPAIHAIRAERDRLLAFQRDHQAEWLGGMIQAYANVLKTIDPLTDTNAPRDDWGVGVGLWGPKVEEAA